MDAGQRWQLGNQRRLIAVFKAVDALKEGQCDRLVEGGMVRNRFVLLTVALAARSVVLCGQQSPAP
jgi:hypothetical protein